MAVTLDGVASGMDTTKLIDEMLQAKRIPMYRLDNKNQELQKKVNAWSDVDTKLTELQSSSQELTNYTNWQQNTASSTNSDVVDVTAAESASAGTYNVDVTHLAQSHMIASDAQADTTSSLGYSGSFDIGGETVSVASDDNLGDIRDKINNLAGNMSDSEKVRATIVDTTLVIERVDNGATQINVGSDPDDILENLGVLNSTKNIKNELRQAQDLDSTVNGINVTRSDNTGISDVVDGVTFDFRSTGSATVEVSRDIESIKAMFQDFVDKYNSAMQTMEEKSKIEVSEGEVEETGPIHSDSQVDMVSNRLRTSVMQRQSAFPDSFDQLEDIGISTSGRENRLSLDTEQLDSALKNNFNDVEKMVRDFSDGILTDFNDYLNGAVLDPVSGVVNNRQNTLQSRINRNEEEIQEIQDRVEKRRQSLKEKFASMEETIGKLNSQLSYVQSALGGGGGNIDVSSASVTK